MKFFQEPNIFKFSFPLGTELEVSLEESPIISDFIKQEWQLISAHDGIDKSIHYGPNVTYQLSQYGDYTLKSVITNSVGTEKVFYKSFNVPKPNNIIASIQVETPDWQLGNTFQARVVSESTDDFTTSLAFAPSGMTVTEGGEISWDGNFFDFGNHSKLNFGVYIETTGGKSLIKHTLMIDSQLDKKQSKLAQLTYRTTLYTDNINKHRSKFLYKKNNISSYAHTIEDSGFSQLDVSENSVDLDYSTYDGNSFAQTLFDVSYNLENDAIDYLLLQNSSYIERLDEDKLKIATDLPWVLFNSNSLDNYIEVIGDESTDIAATVIDKIDAQFIESNNHGVSDIVYSNMNTHPDNKLKLVDQNFAIQSELQSSKGTKIVNGCKFNDNEQILIGYNSYVHVKNNDSTLYSIDQSSDGNIVESGIFALDQDNNNYCDTFLLVSNRYKQGYDYTQVEAFQITSSGPIKVDAIEMERIYSFKQLKTIYDTGDLSESIIVFDSSSASNYNSPNEPVNATTLSLSTENKITRKQLIYGTGLGIKLSPNKSHIINLVDTNNDDIDEVIIKHNLSADEELIERFAQSYTIYNDSFEVHVIATLHNGVLVPTYVAELSIPSNHISIKESGDILVGNGSQPIIVTPHKEVKAPNNIEQFTANSIFINNDGSRYQITSAGLEKNSSSNQKIWTTPSVETADDNEYMSLQVLGKYQNIVLISYGFTNNLYFINDDSGELILQPNNIKNIVISPDFNETGLLFIEPFYAVDSIQGSSVYRANQLTGIELIHNWNFASRYRIHSMDVSWINIDDDADFELLFRFNKRDGSNEVLTADYNGNNKKISSFLEYLNPTHDLSRSAAWDTKKLGYFAYDTYRSKLTGDIIWQIPFDSFISDTTYKNGIKRFAVSDKNLYLFETR